MNLTLKNIWRSTVQALAKKLSKGAFELRTFQILIVKLLIPAIVKGGGRFVISVPPQHGKSELISHWLIVWFLENFPRKRVIMTSYELGKATKWGRRVRNTIKENRFDLTVRLAPDSQSKELWHTTEGGSMICQGAGGAITGEGGDLIVIDDPHKDWKEAMSQTRRESIIDWFNTVIYTRRQPKTTFIIIQTRWHDKDLAGWVLSEHADDWTEVRLPAIAEKNDPLGREEGEPLCPELYSSEELERTRKSLGSMQFNALYQQRPGAAEGNIFRRAWWIRYLPEAKPIRFSRIIHSWDTAFETKKASAYSGVTVWAESEGTYWLLYAWRDKCDYTAVRAKMQELYRDIKPDLILLEDKATGKPLRQELRKIGLPILAVEPCTDKVTRAWSVTPLFEDNRIFAPAGLSWADDLVDGLASFPAGDWTDIADTVTQALSWLSQSQALTPETVHAMMQLNKRTGGSCFRFGQSIHDLPNSTRQTPLWFRPR